VVAHCLQAQQINCWQFFVEPEHIESDTEQLYFKAFKFFLSAKLTQFPKLAHLNFFLYQKTLIPVFFWMSFDIYQRTILCNYFCPLILQQKQLLA
jgi:hypothetical protein